MDDILQFNGFVQQIEYKAYLAKQLRLFPFNEFDPNDCDASGLIISGAQIAAYSKWVSPKRTRSYPLSRVYDTFGWRNQSNKIVTIIPVLKDEGESGDLDKIQYSTISWMNLLDIYIVLGYYESADKNIREEQLNKQKLTNQKFNSIFIKSQIQEILDFQYTASEWNSELFSNRFTEIFRQALSSYLDIEKVTGVKVHAQKSLERYLETIIVDFNQFQSISLRGSQAASQREVRTFHTHECLLDGQKAAFLIEDHLGGRYYLTPDEILKSTTGYIIQESKNSTRRALPGLSDIQDGLFKLILYANINTLLLDGRQVDFSVRLKLTGKNVRGRIVMPCESSSFDRFINENSSAFGKKDAEILSKLMVEAQENEKIEVEVSTNLSS